MKSFVVLVLSSCVLAQLVVKGIDAQPSPVVAPQPSPPVAPTSKQPEEMCGEPFNMDLFQANGLTYSVDKKNGMPLITKVALDKEIRALYGDFGVAMTKQRDIIDKPKLNTTAYYHHHHNYHPECPALWFYVPYHYWYFVHEGMKCYAIHNYVISHCIHNYCNDHFKWDVWSNNHVCLDEYTEFHIPSVCINKDGKFLKAIVLRKLPDGCCCYRYWPFGLNHSLQCKTGH